MAKLAHPGCLLNIRVSYNNNVFSFRLNFKENTHKINLSILFFKKITTWFPEYYHKRWLNSAESLVLLYSKCGSYEYLNSVSVYDNINDGCIICIRQNYRADLDNMP